MALSDIGVDRDYPNFSEHGEPPCSQSDPDAFFPEPGVPDAFYLARLAVAVCAECPYKQACLEYATERRLPGIWGGTSELQRRKLRMADRNKYPKR